MNTQSKEKLTEGFLIIPQEVLTLTKVNGENFSFAEKAVYSYLLHWTKSVDSVFPSTTKICKELGIGSRTSLSKYLSKLELLNLLVIEKRKGKSSIYTVLGFDGKILSTPKEDSLVRGTNMEDKQPKVESPKPKWEPNPFEEDPWAGQFEEEPPF